MRHWSLATRRLCLDVGTSLNAANANTAPPWSIESTHGIDFNGDSDQLDRVLFRQLDLATPWSTGMGASYTGPTFFGGFTAFRQSTATQTERPMRLSFKTTPRPTIFALVVRNATGHLVFLFQTSEPVKFVTGDSISQRTQQRTSSSGRFVVQSGGSFIFRKNDLAATDTTITLTLGSYVVPLQHSCGDE